VDGIVFCGCDSPRPGHPSNTGACRVCFVGDVLIPVVSVAVAFVTVVLVVAALVVCVVVGLLVYVLSDTRTTGVVDVDVCNLLARLTSLGEASRVSVILGFSTLLKDSFKYSVSSGVKDFSPDDTVSILPINSDIFCLPIIIVGHPTL